MMTIYLKIDGLDGHVTTKGYEKWIEIDSFDFGLNRNIATKPGNVCDRESTKPKFTEFNISKPVDKTTPKIFELACVGKATINCKIHVCKTGPDKMSPYIEYTLQHVLISHYHCLSEEKCEHKIPMENICLNFDKIEIKYTPYDAEHNALSPIPTGYDLALGTKI